MGRSSGCGKVITPFSGLDGRGAALHLDQDVSHPAL